MLISLPPIGLLGIDAAAAAAVPPLPPSPLPNHMPPDPAIGTLSALMFRTGGGGGGGALGKNGEFGETTGPYSSVGVTGADSERPD